MSKHALQKRVSWFLVGGKTTAMPTFRSEAELGYYLGDLKHVGCLVVRAFTESASDENVRGESPVLKNEYLHFKVTK